MSEQRCGTCQHWEETRSREYSEQLWLPWFGRCQWKSTTPQPEALMMRATIGDTQGVACPCYERKERDGLERHAAE
jgi:hypothetical protein